jgi:phage terminase large subunit-like protein
MFGLRIGPDPRTIVTTTPKPRPILKDILKQSTTVVTSGSTYDNFANLAPAFIEQIISKYEGTRLGRQELHAELLEDREGALWTRLMLDSLRVTKHPKLIRIVVAVDPEATSTEGSAETGIIVCGLGIDKHGYALEDCSIQGTPDTWGKAVIAAKHRHNADRIVAEANQGGEMVEYVIRTIDMTAPYKSVHASKSKIARAEPIAALTEQSRIHHCGMFGLLEDQLCEWVPGEKSPDRLDAYVWGFTELMIQAPKAAFIPTASAGVGRPA